jgi:hypothetical protein
MPLPLIVLAAALYKAANKSEQKPAKSKKKSRAKAKTRAAKAGGR